LPDPAVSLPERYRTIMDAYDPEDICLEAVMRRVDLAGCERVLEVGIGDARLGSRLVGLPKEYWGLDPNPGVLSIARERSRGLLLVVGSAERAPFAGGSFDLVLCPFVLHHVANRKEALSELVRILKPGGGFVSIDFGGGGDYLDLKEELRPGSRRFVEERRRAVLEAVEGSELEVIGKGSFRTWYLLPTLEDAYMFFEEFGIEYEKLKRGRLDSFLEDKKVREGYKISESADITVAQRGG